MEMNIISVLRFHASIYLSRKIDMFSISKKHRLI
uniref:Transcriptional regulator n=1 Tax=Heterorhabditis bacteriophora TaxID=37862 RepID=A0A1I7WIG1_HETBA